MNERFRNWRKSLRSQGGNGACVEVGSAADGTVGVRDTKQLGQGPVLEFGPAEWVSFVRGIHGGKFDLPSRG